MTRNLFQPPQAGRYIYSIWRGGIEKFTAQIRIASGAKVSKVFYSLNDARAWLVSQEENLLSYENGSGEGVPQKLPDERC